MDNPALMMVTVIAAVAATLFLSHSVGVCL